MTADFAISPISTVSSGGYQAVRRVNTGAGQNDETERIHKHHPQLSAFLQRKLKAAHSRQLSVREIKGGRLFLRSSTEPLLENARRCLRRGFADRYHAEKSLARTA